MGDFLGGTTVFDNEDVLREEFTPERILCRDEERSEIVATLQSVANGAQPSNCLIYGKAGVGKTVVMKSVLNELEEDMKQVDGVDVKVVWVNCKNEGSSYKTTVALANAFRDESNKVPESGLSESRVRDKLFAEVEKCDATHVIFALDEVDALGTDDDLLYSIPRARDNGDITDTKVAITGISNDFSFKNDLSARVKSSLCESKIHFSGYDADQLFNILKQRAEKAFVDGKIEDSELRLIAAYAASEDGSARVGLDILLQAGHVARKNDIDTIREEHVRTAYDNIEAAVDMAEIKSLANQEALALYAIYQLQDDGRTPAPLIDIYDVYTELAEALDKNIRTKRTIHDRIDSLELSGFLAQSEENKGPNGGRRYQWEIDLPMKDVKEALAANDTDLDIETENATIQQFN